MKRVLTIGLLLWPHAAHADSLPKAMLGVWATDPAACSEQSSEIKMTVERKAVLTYEVAQTVRRIARLKDGSLRVSGHTETDDGRAPGSLTLKLIGEDKLRVGPDQIYHRCPANAGKPRR